LAEDDFTRHVLDVVLLQVQQTLGALFMMVSSVLIPTVNVLGTLTRMFCSDSALVSGC
jgi:hypothetical protein